MILSSTSSTFNKHIEGNDWVRAEYSKAPLTFNGQWNKYARHAGAHLYFKRIFRLPMGVEISWLDLGFNGQTGDDTSAELIKRGFLIPPKPMLFVFDASKGDKYQIWLQMGKEVQDRARNELPCHVDMLKFVEVNETAIQVCKEKCPKIFKDDLCEID